ncbi:hypothetical protein PTTG_29849 [Puccinia triticina 1-1 BBBD Race 1]|uniref:MULE transposase domain-containing protein n=1 Tax=Puccinia triticina (isolate 1-1 / race 1 (BBBD)) TaxID=630390 RepID=A0A180G1G0_PUCT1|nr:hypothetical protein PTTG_29849 [Puccinia triticina 1-1 BBBD Race 1]
MRPTSYPFIGDIYEVVPLPFTQSIPTPSSATAVPNSLRMLRRAPGFGPTFPTPIHSFTIPGCTRAEAKDFITAMQATVMWSRQRSPKKKIVNPIRTGKRGRPADHFFWIDLICPRSGIHKAVPNSRKQHTLSRKCGCKSKFSIFHHIKTNTLRVEWSWIHNHNPFSEDEMKINHLPKMVEDWLTERVVAGLSWNAIYELSLCQDLFAMVEPGVVPEASYIKYDHVRYLIRTRMAVVAKQDAYPFVSITLWASNLQQQGWSTLIASSRDSPDFIFAFQSPWQQQQLLDHGQGMYMIDSTHNTVDNASLSDGRKFSLYTIVIRDPVVGKGLPVCWAFTASAAAEPVEQLLRWL